ncbi:hypothetical protein [Herbaspirillum seropedicae]|uniref:hypothetical protein n=1 Tax=Herbaspirillum seropedicae TaxID=964 RepID=UPI0031E15B64
MRYVTYSVSDYTLISASGGPIESHISNLQNGQAVGDLGEHGADFSPIDDLGNYRFYPEHVVQDGIPTRGFVALKPHSERDHQKSEIFLTQQRNMTRFHRLEMEDISELKMYFNIPLRFDFLESREEFFRISFDDTELDVFVRKKGSSETQAFDFGGKLYQFVYSEISFSLPPNLPFLREEVESFLRGKDAGFEVFTGTVLQSTTLKISLRIINKLIDAYRVIYEDPAATPIGFANILNSALVVTLHGGAQSHYMTGSPYQDAMTTSKLFPRQKKTHESLKQEMQELLQKRNVPFLLAALSSLKSAHLNGHYRECVIWGATIISNVLEDFLLGALPDDSPEFRALKNKGADIRGKDRRNKFFSVATGKTLAEYLRDVIEKYDGSAFQDDYWTELPRHVESVLQIRNLMLHRKKGISPIEADEAFYTCMNFLFAMSSGVPYSALYSNDYNLKLLDSFL